MATRSQKEEFYRVYGPIVEEQCRGTGLYPEVILAQLALESDFGVSPAAHGNLGGRKVSESQKRRGVENQDYEIRQAFEDFTTQEAADAFAKQQKDLGYKLYSVKEEEPGSKSKGKGFDDPAKKKADLSGYKENLAKIEAEEGAARPAQARVD